MAELQLTGQLQSVLLSGLLGAAQAVTAAMAAVAPALSRTTPDFTPNQTA